MLYHVACELQILKLLNSNSENPLLIWDNSTRAELMEFLATEQQNKIRTVRYIYVLSMMSAASR